MTSMTIIKNTLSSVVYSLLMWCCVPGMIFVIYLKFLVDLLLKIAEVMFDLCDRFDNKVDVVVSWTYDRVEEYNVFTGLLVFNIVLMLWTFWSAVSFSYDFFVYPGFSVKTFLSAIVLVFMTITLFVVFMVISETIKYANRLRWKVKTDA